MAGASRCRREIQWFPWPLGGKYQYESQAFVLVRLPQRGMSGVCKCAQSRSLSFLSAVSHLEHAPDVTNGAVALFSAWSPLLVPSVNYDQGHTYAQLGVSNRGASRLTPSQSCVLNLGTKVAAADTGSRRLASRCRQVQSYFVHKRHPDHSPRRSAQAAESRSISTSDDPDWKSRCAQEGQSHRRCNKRALLETFLGLANNRLH